ncbi:MAG TPA: hypothetical protein VF367_05775 [Candidatus Limnocylindria bacterium]
MDRRLGVLVACLVVLASGAAAPRMARAADGLVITSDAVYEVRPDDGVIAVTVNVAATNVTPDTAEGRFYYTAVALPVPVGASSVTADSNGVPLAVSVAPLDETAQRADVTFHAGVFFQQTYGFTLRFLITDAGGDADRETWVRSRFVAFPVWSYGTAGAANASVEVILPADFVATVPVGDLETVTEGGQTRLVTSSIPDPTTFFAYVSAEREGDRDSSRLSVELEDGTASLLLFSWPDDPEWVERQRRFLAGGLPALEDAIGVPYPIIGVLNVTEHAYQHLGDYAGFFIPGDDSIEVRFDADAFTTLHEAAHVWFNSDISDARWLVEGFASYYAEQVGTELGESLLMNELTDEVRDDAFPLDEWGDPGREAPEREEYGYAAAHEFARQVAALAGTDGLRSVWQAESVDRMAYATHDDERPQRGDAAPDEEWQRLLDLFENDTGADFDALWTEWIVGDESALLAEREAARAAYATTTAELGSWTMPRSTRVLMESWDFASATTELEAVDDLVDDAAALAERADALDVTAPDEVGASLADGIDAARATLDAQAGALDAIAAADAGVQATRSAAATVGMLGEADPSAELAAARDAFTSGDEASATQRAERAVDAIEAADGRGRLRVGVAGGIILLLDALAMGVLFRRRRARRGLASA